jgi:hypothetical protein
MTLALAFASEARAQYKPAGDDGITASPKLRQFLDEHQRNHSPAPKPVEIPQMACPKCTDFTYAIPDLEPRGLGARTLMARGTPMKWVRSHDCLACGTEWKTVGHGKAKQSIATHTCTSRCGSKDLACCNTAKSSTAATKGMETKINVILPR